MSGKRLIDANALKEYLGCDDNHKYSSMIMHEIADRIDEQPTIDANEALKKAEHEIEKLKKTIGQLKEIARGDCQWCKHDHYGQMNEICESCVHYSWENTPGDHWEFELEEAPNEENPDPVCTEV